jgi:hypothetical protein
MWAAALFTLLLWPLGLFLLSIWLIQITIAVLQRGNKDEVLDRMRDKFAENVTRDFFRCQPAGSEIVVPRGFE